MNYKLKFMVPIKMDVTYSDPSSTWIYRNIFFNVSTHKYNYFYLFNNIIKKKKNSFRKGKNIRIFQPSIVHSHTRVGFLMVVLFDKSKQNHWL